MGYGELISTAFRITRENRYLWFFGLFAGTSGPSFNFSSSIPTDDSGSIDVDLTVVIVAVAVVLALAIISAVLSVIAQGGLTDSVAAIAHGERRNFRTTWRAGTGRFWRVLGYGLLIALVALGFVLAAAILVGAVALVALLVVDQVLLWLLLLILAGIAAVAALAAVFLPFTAVAQLGLRELVLRGSGVFDSLGRGWQLFRGNIGTSLVLLLIQQGIAFAAALAVGLGILALALPTIFLAVAASTTVAIVAGAVTGVIVLPLALAAFGAIGAWGHAFWTLGYLRLTPPWPAAAPG